ncbi:hypothetical protein EJ05DRAFT_504723 [Pseudovirgaria hyperparasitica]|uniref:peptidylprolyl isomerase n=1 Tax=Pseudovirgaria hyperparasitica TaxID=470096 RepID=A0A6A6VSI3_9PEZI|nr:uncharacterized protein EJ05DRAFT_504723 [Pseudovirgaria hyperparasitica]KAF2753628.1 hypothetical protein EJ05DRAFT_504723 [Pseudovirgaria hyperparasitica]
MVQQPVRVYALEVPPGDMPIPAGFEDLPASIRISMAAIDPSAPAQLDLAPADQTVPRATLKIIKVISAELSESEDDEDDYDSDDIAALEARLRPALGGSDEDSEEDSEDDESDDEVNGGPSDPAKTKKARKDAAVKQILEALIGDDDMDVDDMSNGVNGIKKNKGKGKASDEDDDEEIDSDEADSEDGELEEHVICTLDTTQHYQQPIDITVSENEQVYFKVIGTHSVFLTGNYIADVKDESDDEDYEDDDEMDLYGGLGGMDEDSDDYDEESDELDDIADPRVTEVESEEEEAPKLVKAEKKDKKGKNKRAAEDSEEDASTLDDLIAKSMKSGEAASGEKLSKKQLKKLKNNQGLAVAGADEVAKKEANGTTSKSDKKEVNGTNGTPQSAKSDKKVQFAKNLEQGPTGSPLPKAGEKEDAKPKQALGVKNVRGVKIDDKKLGKGPAAKKGDKIGMRYIGKLEKDGKVFDSNKKGKPFTFVLGKGEVITGWEIGVDGMTVGAERRLTIPSKLAYGNKSLPGIPANSNLVFDIKLISIN